MNKSAVIVIPVFNPQKTHYDNICRFKELFYDGFDIFVVDNHSDNFEYINLIKELDFITYEINDFGKTYEVGALLHVYNKRKYPTYFLFQDSLEVYDFAFMKNYSNFYANYVLALKEFFPALSCFDESLAERQFFDERVSFLTYLLDHTPGIFGCNFGCKRHHLDALSKFTLVKDNLPHDKHGSISWERILSLSFRHLQFTCNFVLSRYHSFNCFAFRKHFSNRQ
jgi:hypothetical protein